MLYWISLIDKALTFDNLFVSIWIRYDKIRYMAANLYAIHYQWQIHLILNINDSTLSFHTCYYLTVLCFQLAPVAVSQATYTGLTSALLPSQNSRTEIFSPHILILLFVK